MVNRREANFAAGRSKVGARFIVHSCYEGRGEATPLPSDALQPLTNPTANRYPQKPLSAFPYLAISFRLSTVMPWLDRTEAASSWASVRTTSP